MWSKRITAILFALAASNVFALTEANTGFYLGLGGGGAHFSPVPGADLTSRILSTTLYIRPYLGYRFNQHFALEGGYSDISNSSSEGNSVEGPDHYRLYSFDLAVKAIAPIENGYSFYAKGGAAYTHQDVYNQPYAGGKVTANSITNAVQPLAGVGVTYNFTKNTAADVSVTHLFKSGNVGEINMIGVGISYTFN